MNSWLRAARLKMLPLSLSSIVFSSIYAYEKGYFSTIVFLLLCLATLSFQILANFANDYGDGVKGTDDHRGTERMVGGNSISPKSMKKAIMIMSIISAIITISIVLYGLRRVDTAAITLLLLGVVTIIAAIKYTVGKNAYGYSGLGDIFVFLFFGLSGTMASFYIYSLTIPNLLWLPATAIGLLCVTVLNLNNIRDIETDAHSGKRTLVVKMGLKKATFYHYCLIILPLLILPTFTYLSGSLNFFYLIAYPLFIRHLYHFSTKSKSIDQELKKVSVSTFILSILLGISTLA